MFWRLLTVLIGLFWAVMTVLLVREAYFPERGRAQLVPPGQVLERFLAGAETSSSTLHLYQGGDKAGHLTLVFRRLAEVEGLPVLGLLASGVFEWPGQAGVDVSFRLNAELENWQSWRRLRLDLDATDLDASARFAWTRGEAAPLWQVRRQGRVMLDETMIRAFLAAQGLHAEAWPAAGQTEAKMPLLQARETRLELAGRQRPGYVLTLGWQSLNDLRACFTETGELARIDLPNGYRLIEPLLHGLETASSLPE